MDDRALVQWLALRESVDAASRSPGLTQAVADVVRACEPVRVLDLATGTGSNIRYLMRHLPRRQHWLAVDQSPELLQELPVRMSQWGASGGREVATNTTRCTIRDGERECEIETAQRDLNILDSADLFARRDLVTASALLDLVSEKWLYSLAARCREAGAAALFTITYNGRWSCSPAEPEDDLVRSLFNRHQHTDKGLGGPAAGPDAAGLVVRAFTEAGYTVRSEPSDWRLGADHAALQRELIEGWAEAATEIEQEAASTVAAWRIRRLRHVEAARSHLVVGHDDVAAWPNPAYRIPPAAADGDAP